MEKSIFTKDYQKMLSELRKSREKEDITQAQLGKKLKQTQSWISKVERGERRLDVIELKHWLKAINTNLNSFIKKI